MPELKYCVLSIAQRRRGCASLVGPCALHHRPARVHSLVGPCALHRRPARVHSFVGRGHTCLASPWSSLEAQKKETQKNGEQLQTLLRVWDATTSSPRARLPPGSPPLGRLPVLLLRVSGGSQPMSARSDPQADQNNRGSWVKGQRWDRQSCRDWRGGPIPPLGSPGGGKVRGGCGTRALDGGRPRLIAQPTGSPTTQRQRECAAPVVAAVRLPPPPWHGRARQQGCGRRRGKRRPVGCVAPRLPRRNYA